MGVHEELCHLVGAEFPPVIGVDAVCTQMVRHWCEAMQEDNSLCGSPTGRGPAASCGDSV